MSELSYVGLLFGLFVLPHCMPLVDGFTKVSASDLAALSIERQAFHGDWNYIIRPMKKP